MTNMMDGMHNTTNFLGGALLGIGTNQGTYTVSVVTTNEPAFQSMGGASAWRYAQRTYRRHLFMTGDETPAGPGAGAARAGASRRGFSAERVKAVLAQGGKLSRAELLRCRVRYFTDGVVLGSREFVDAVYRRNRAQFGRKRKDGARAMRGGDWGALCTMRDLRLAVICVNG
ncbi:MAG: hypothetical protein JXR37_26995 [Kiritimatiellae bacterium]|nr:hypothetical protein [Kiritimatiellia bacterium]